MFLFIVLPGVMPDPRIQLPNLTKPLGDGPEIRLGRKACAHNVGKEMAYRLHGNVHTFRLLLNK